MGQEGLPTAIGVIIGAAVLGAMIIAGFVLGAILAI